MTTSTFTYTCCAATMDGALIAQENPDAKAQIKSFILRATSVVVVVVNTPPPLPHKEYIKIINVSRAFKFHILFYYMSNARRVLYISRYTCTILYSIFLYDILCCIFSVHIQRLRIKKHILVYEMYNIQRMPSSWHIMQKSVFM